MIGTIIEIFATAIDIVFLIWFVPKLNGVRLKNRPQALVWALAFFVFQLTADHLFQITNIISTSVVFVLSLFFSFALEKKKRLWNVFAALVYLIIIMLSNTLVFSVFSLFTNNFNAVVQGDVSYVRLLYILVCKMIQLSLYRLVLLIFKKDQNIDFKNGILSFLFTIVTAIGIGILVKLATDIYFGQLEVLITVLAFFLVALNIMLYLMINQVQSLLKNKYELSLMREKMESERSRAEEATIIWDNIRKLKHDLKNHFTVLSSKLEIGDVDDCVNYLSNLNHTVESMGNLIRSGHSVIDYLINSKLSNLDDIQVLVSGYVGNYHDIHDVDLVSILGNILDNAIEAQEDVTGEKRIELHFLQKNASRVIVCKNTVAMSVLQNNKKLKSTKNDSELHGIGHQIVETTVQKYHGMVNYYEEDKMFGVQIILPLN